MFYRQNYAKNPVFKFNILRNEKKLRYLHCQTGKGSERGSASPIRQEKTDKQQYIFTK